MISAARIRQRLIAGDTYKVIAADLGVTPNALKKRARRLGVASTQVLGRHRRRPYISVAELNARRQGRAS